MDSRVFIEKMKKMASNSSDCSGKFPENKNKQNKRTIVKIITFWVHFGYALTGNDVVASKEAPVRALLHHTFITHITSSKASPGRPIHSNLFIIHL